MTERGTKDTKSKEEKKERGPRKEQREKGKQRQEEKRKGSRGKREREREAEAEGKRKGRRGSRGKGERGAPQGIAWPSPDIYPHAPWHRAGQPSPLLLLVWDKLDWAYREAPLPSLAPSMIHEGSPGVR